MLNRLHKDPHVHACSTVCSSGVRPRKPFGRDMTLDYEVESDQDWEEEPEGEDIMVSLWT